MKELAKKIKKLRDNPGIMDGQELAGIIDEVVGKVKSDLEDAYLISALSGAIAYQNVVEAREKVMSARKTLETLEDRLDGLLIAGKQLRVALDILREEIKGVGDR